MPGILFFGLSSPIFQINEKLEKKHLTDQKFLNLKFNFPAITIIAKNDFRVFSLNDKNKEKGLNLFETEIFFNDESKDTIILKYLKNKSTRFRLIPVNFFSVFIDEQNRHAIIIYTDKKQELMNYLDNFIIVDAEILKFILKYGKSGEKHENTSQK